MANYLLKFSPSPTPYNSYDPEGDIWSKLSQSDLSLPIKRKWDYESQKKILGRSIKDNTLITYMWKFQLDNLQKKGEKRKSVSPKQEQGS